MLSLNQHTLRDIEDDVRSVAKAVGCPDRGERLVAGLEEKAGAVRRLTGGVRRLRVFCVEWLEPVMSAGHWFSECVECAGGVDGLAVSGGRSTRIGWDSVLDYDPEVVVLMPCGFTTERTVRESQQFLKLPNV